MLSLNEEYAGAKPAIACRVIIEQVHAKIVTCEAAVLALPARWHAARRQHPAHCRLDLASGARCRRSSVDRLDAARTLGGPREREADQSEMLRIAVVPGGLQV